MTNKLATIRGYILFYHFEINIQLDVAQRKISIFTVTQIEERGIQANRGFGNKLDKILLLTVNAASRAP